RAFGGGLNDVGNGVAVDSGGNVVIIGTASGTVSFGGGPITANGYTIVVAKFSPAGAHLWSRGFGDSFSNSGNGVAVDPSGNIAVTGAFSGPIDVGGGALISAASDILLATLSLAGGLYDDAGRGIAVDRSGKVVVTGTFQAAVNFGTGSLISAGRTDIFVARYSPDGTPLVAQRFGSADFDAGNAVAVDGSGRPV